MRITVEGEPEEIAALVLELQERQTKEISGKTIEEIIEELNRGNGDGVMECFKQILKDQ